MKNQMTSIALAAAAALFSANAAADSIHSVINIDDEVVTTNNTVVDPKVTIQDYVDATRDRKLNASKVTVDIRALSGVEKAL